MKKTILTMCVVMTFVFGTSVVFTGCRNKNDDNKATTEGTSENASASTDEDSVADAVDDVANGFDNYDDAHDYLLNRLGKDNKNAKYEVRNETKDTKEYRDGAKGYHFEIYDTSDDSGKKYGDFYVDKDTGKIYRKDTKTKKVTEYKSNSK